MTRIWPFGSGTGGKPTPPKKEKWVLLTLGERRLLLGVLLLFAQGLAVRAYNLRLRRAAVPDGTPAAATATTTKEATP